MTTYKKSEAIQHLQKSIAKGGSLYQMNCINRKGKTDGVEYGELYARDILENFKNISVSKENVKRKKNYLIDHKSAGVNFKGSRHEENTAKILYYSGKIENELGRFLDFQVPLKDSMRDESVGKIDLISVKNGNLFIVELKIKNKSDSLLKTILEIKSYEEQLDCDKLIKECVKKYKLENRTYKIKKAILLDTECKALEQYRNRKTNLNTLIDLWNIKVVVLD
jgi:hypothetical protein